MAAEEIPVSTKTTSELKNLPAIDVRMALAGDSPKESIAPVRG
jgi:hypothetical protein